MVTEVAKKQELLIPDMKAQLAFGRKALQELRTIVQSRPDKLVINGKQYLYYSDWQLLGTFFGITPYVMDTKAITREKPSEDGTWTFLEVVGYSARAVAFKDGKQISAAEAVCLKEEKNWAKKDRFQLLSMAQTRACAKALRNVLQWVVRLPDERKPKETPEFSDEVAEEQPAMFE